MAPGDPAEHPQCFSPSPPLSRRLLINLIVLSRWPISCFIPVWNSALPDLWWCSLFSGFFFFFCVCDLNEMLCWELSKKTYFRTYQASVYQHNGFCFLSLCVWDWNGHFNSLTLKSKNFSRTILESRRLLCSGVVLESAFLVSFVVAFLSKAQTEVTYSALWMSSALVVLLFSTENAREVWTGSGKTKQILVLH